MSSFSADLPDPDTTTDSDVVIYDGACNFCRSQVKNLRRLDQVGPRLSFISLHDERVGERYPELSKEDLMRQMYVIDRRGTAHGGADAVRYLSRRLPLLWIAAPVLHLPKTAGLWQWMYDQVAKRRYRLAGKSCDNGSCRIGK